MQEVCSFHGSFFEAVLFSGYFSPICSATNLSNFDLIISVVLPKEKNKTERSNFCKKLLFLKMLKLKTLKISSEKIPTSWILRVKEQFWAFCDFDLIKIVFNRFNVSRVKNL